MGKLLISFLLIFATVEPIFANHWRWRNRNRYNTHYHYPTNGYSSRTSGTGISPGAATAIGLGVGVLGFIVGRATKKTTESSDSKIECKEFPILVTIDGEEKKAKVTKCKTQDGNWQIPD